MDVVSCTSAADTEHMTNTASSKATTAANAAAAAAAVTLVVTNTNDTNIEELIFHENSNTNNNTKNNNNNNNGDTTSTTNKNSNNTNTNDDHSKTQVLPALSISPTLPNTISKSMKNDHSNNSHRSTSQHPQPQLRLSTISTILPSAVVVSPPPQYNSNNHNNNNNNSHSHANSHYYTSSIPTVTTTMKSMTYYQTSILQPPPISFPLSATTTLLLGITTEYWYNYGNVYLVDIHYMMNWLIWCLHQSTNTVVHNTTKSHIPHSTLMTGGENHNNESSSGGMDAVVHHHHNGNSHSSSHPPRNHHHNEHQRLQDCVRTIALQYQLPMIPTIGMSYTNPGPIPNDRLSYSQEYPFLLFPTDPMTSPTDNDNNNNNDESSSILQVYQPCVDPYAATSTLLVHSNGTITTATTTTTTTTMPYPITQRDVSIRSLPDQIPNNNNNNNNMNLDSTIMMMDDSSHYHHSDNNNNNNNNKNGSKMRSCMALPETFYELIRSIHGVGCDDHHTISFQSSMPLSSSFRGSNGNSSSDHHHHYPSSSSLDDNDIILHHHSYHLQSIRLSEQQQQQGGGGGDVEQPPPRPIEFRRKIVYQMGVVGKSSLSNNNTTSQPAAPQSSQIKKTGPGSKKQLVSMPSTTSLMDKLLLEQQVEQKYLMVEVHPIKLYYSYYDEKDQIDNNNPITSNNDDTNGNRTSTSTSGSNNGSSLYQPKRCGFILVSRDTPAIYAFMALRQLTAPHKVKQCVRLWSQWSYSTGNNNNNNTKSFRNPTNVYDGYELIDMDRLTEEKIIPLQQQLAIEMGNRPTNGQQSTHPLLVTIGSYVERHHIARNINELDILIETRRTVDTTWPRQQYELPVRIQPGDYVDAQDVTGQWYEAIVRQVHDDNTVLVHYTGWASRWDTKIRRQDIPNPTDPASVELPPLSPSIPTRVKAPAPLWSQSGRWRERLKVGDMVEVRDSSSLVDRPKWYKGIVQYIGGKNEKPRTLTGGADIELYDVIDPTNPDSTMTTRQPLLLLNRTQQILVEVEQERIAKTGNTNHNNITNMPLLTSASSVSDSLAPHPPYIRWVNLFGEEICKIGTHLKEAKDEKPVTLRYEYDVNRKPVAVMKSHPTLGSGFVRESLRGTPPAPGSVGLHNLGNSCFLNSTVQCLNHISFLTHFFVHDKYSKDLNRRNPLGSGGNVAVAYASLLKKIWAGEHSVLVPRMLKQTVANFAPQFDNSYQHDSHEFCQFLMDGLHEDLNRVKTKPYVEELEGFGLDDEKAAIESWKKHLLRHDSVIVDHCQGMHRSHLTCPQCGRESIKFDVYSSISLPLPTDKNKGTIRLEDCIEKFMEAEQLDDRDAYYCPNCRKHVCALKLIALWTIPDVLILHLKRFTFDTCMSSGSMLRSKVDNKVEFPINNLDLSKIVLGPKDPSAPPIYNLYGVSEHIGATANSGHYTATVRNSIDGQWYRCNDSHVGLTSGEASITGGAYLLFYQRAKGSTRWGGMYRAMKELNIDPYGISEPIDKEGFRQVKLKKKKKP